ncbi:MAG: sulfite exporter TauE/SafE family protein [Anaerolineae bacterium]
MVETFLLCLIAGFAAQMIDGSLGMGYGIILSIILSSMGMSPIGVSASVHVAKFFATGASGFSHLKFGNVDKALATKLALGGIVGAIVGAFILKNVPGDIIKPVTAVYLTVMGILIVYKARHKAEPRDEIRRVTPLGVLGGFCDAIGGGGWGAIVTSGLLVKGKNPRLAIGSVSLAEFFVSITIIGLLITEVPQLVTQIHIIAGLVVGSALAAPIAAYVCGRVAPRPLLAAVGSLIIILSGSTVLGALLALGR